MKLELTLIALLLASLAPLHAAADTPRKKQKPAPEHRKYELETAHPRIIRCLHTKTL